MRCRRCVRADPREVEGSFGRPLEEIYASFDPDPVGGGLDRAGLTAPPRPKASRSRSRCCVPDRERFARRRRLGKPRGRAAAELSAWSRRLKPVMGKAVRSLHVGAWRWLERSLVDPVAAGFRRHKRAPNFRFVCRGFLAFLNSPASLEFSTACLHASLHHGWQAYSAVYRSKAENAAAASSCQPRSSAGHIRLDESSAPRTTSPRAFVERCANWAFGPKEAARPAARAWLPSRPLKLWRREREAASAAEADAS